MRRTEHHRVAVAGPAPAWLRVPPGVPTYGADGTTVSEFTAAPGSRVPSAPTRQPSHLAAAPRTDPEALLATTPADRRARAGQLGSRPVRFGNAGVGLLPLDVHGEVVEALGLALRAGLPMERQVWSLLRMLLGSPAARRRETDEGLREVRCGRRQFTRSKVMARVAADRAVQVAEATGLPAPVEQWRLGSTPQVFTRVALVNTAFRPGG
ncbi:hypothetical protein HUT16_30645 [Kitasatospora sp. NA04385]|uniref:glycoside hydrolase family 15 protein n=1 Tax=Kitasatospora sp. NA04385 TaxID=2742135 RepID=UPI001591ABF7|nr:glycoside hydrolase family 15 protein [Kitasatospora sp. NA04385]QKW22871.1 hypothetical protein HUT16_30645 [Kitasatospora sp. NA04385]